MKTPQEIATELIRDGWDNGLAAGRGHAFNTLENRIAAAIQVERDRAERAGADASELALILKDTDRAYERLQTTLARVKALVAVWEARAESCAHGADGAGCRCAGTYDQLADELKAALKEDTP